MDRDQPTKGFVVNINMSYLNQLEKRYEVPYFFKQFYFTELLPKEQGAMLSYLIAMENYSRIRLKDDPSFFECNVNGFINKRLKGWSILEIKTAINNLVNAGYINKRIISNNKTFISLNHKMLDKLYDKWFEEQDLDDNDSPFIEVDPNKK